MVESTPYSKKNIKYIGVTLAIILLAIMLILVVIKLYDYKIKRIKHSNSQQIIFNSSKDISIKNFKHTCFTHTTVFISNSSNKNHTLLNRTHIYGINYSTA